MKLPIQLNPALAWVKRFSGDIARPSRPMVGYFGLWVLAVFFLAAKNGFNSLFHPVLYVEDGEMIFTLFYNEHDFKNVFSFHNGYRTLLPYLIGYFLVFLPVTTLPYLLTAIALSISAVVCCLMFYVVEYNFQNRRWAWGVFLAAALFPLGNYALINSLLYQVWNCFLILVLLLFLPVPASRLHRTLYIAVSTVLILSHPSSLLLAPVYVYRLWTRPENRVVYGSLLVALTGYVLWGMELGGVVNFEGLRFAMPVFLNRVWLDFWLGFANRGMLQWLGMAPWLGAGVALGVLAGLFGLRAGFRSRQKELLIVAAWVMIGSLLLPLVGRYHAMWQFYHQTVANVRYVHAAQHMALLLFLITAFSGLEKTRFRRVAPLALVAILTVININSRSLYHTDPAESRQVLRYVAELEASRMECEPGTRRYLGLKVGSRSGQRPEEGTRIRADLCRH